MPCCGHALDADVEPHRRVEGRLLVDDEVLELVVEDLGLLVVDEVAVLDPPGRQRVGHPVGHLAQRPLALVGAEGPPEVLLRQDVGGVHAPGLGHLDAELLEGHRAVPEVRDAGVAPLPAHLVVGVHAFGGEVPADADLGSLGGDGHGAGVLLVGSWSWGLLLCPARACSVGAVTPTPHSSGAVSHGACSDPAPGRGPSRLTTTYSGWPSPETRDAVSLQHCSYALVNQIARTIRAGHGPFAIVCARKPPARSARHAEYPRTVSVSPPWPRSSPSMRARPACAPWSSTSRPGWPTSPTGS